ncbi:MAG: UDP-glucose dehydrogenase family protein [Acidobacteriota bacterium]
MSKSKEVVSSASPGSMEPVRIAVIGCGYVGLVAAVCFAEIGHSVICIDSDAEKIECLQQGRIPIHEPWLEELLRSQSPTSLRFSTSLADAVRASQVVFIAVGTPPLESGDADLSYVEAVAVEIARSIDSYKVVVEKSTVPVYTSDWIARVLRRNGVRPGEADIVSNPEFLREGTAVTDFLYPDRIIIGTCSDRAFRIMERIYRPLIDGSYSRRPSAVTLFSNETRQATLLRTSAKSAELIKHASNAFLAMKISFINSVANLCEQVNANVEEVARGIGLDRRIGSQFLRPGLGYGGSCFPKDIKAFCSIGEQMGAELTLLREVERINERQRDQFLRKVRSTLWNLRGKHLAVLGLAFKGGTDDIRESPAISLVKSLIAEGATITAFDPAAMANARRAIVSPRLEFAESALQAMDGAAALLILTDWPEFATLDLSEVKARLAQPIVFDGRNLYHPAVMAERGFTYVSMGRAAVEAATEPSELHSAVTPYRVA